jgi:acyl-CoA reductase-like NAD-dependent aldehyde dehydrogenase
MSAADDIKRLSDALASAELWEGYAGQKAAEIALHTAIDALQSERDALVETQRKFGALMHKTMEERDSLLEALRELLTQTQRCFALTKTEEAAKFMAMDRARAAIKASEGKAA